MLNNGGTAGNMKETGMLAFGASKFLSAREENAVIYKGWAVELSEERPRL